MCVSRAAAALVGVGLRPLNSSDPFGTGRLEQQQQQADEADGHEAGAEDGPSSSLDPELAAAAAAFRMQVITCLSTSCAPAFLPGWLPPAMLQMQSLMKPHFFQECSPLPPLP